MRHLLIMALLVVAPACGEATSLHPVAGSVLVAGKPVPGIVVRFHPRPANPDSPIPNGVTAADGRFSLQTSGRAGAPAGDYAVTLSWPPPMGIGPLGQGKSDRLAGRYINPEQPFAGVNIKPGPNELEPFNVPDAVQSPLVNPRSKGTRR